MTEEKIITFEDLPNYGELMTQKYFVKSCLNGWLIDYDGHGRYVTKDKKMTNIYVNPSDVLENQYKSEYPFVMWFNR